MKRVPKKPVSARAKRIRKKRIKFVSETITLVIGMSLLVPWSLYNVMTLYFDGTVYGGVYGSRRYLSYEADGITFVAHAFMYVLMMPALLFTAPIILMWIFRDIVDYWSGRKKW